MTGATHAFGGGDNARQLVPGSLRGYRSWRRVGGRTSVPNGLLPFTAVTRRYVLWAPILTAECTEPDVTTLIQSGAGARMAEPHPSPAASCECGIYAWYAPDDAAVLDTGLVGVFGVIQASGLVLMGDRGFRAERAQVAAVVTRNRRIATACAGAGIAVYRRRRGLLRDFPPENLSALLDREGPTPDEPPDPPPGQSLRGLGFALCLALWARAAVVAIVAVLMPVTAAICAAAAAQLALMLIIGARFRR